MHLVTGLVLALASLASAGDLVISIPSTSLLPNPNTLPSTTHATLLGSDSRIHRALLNRDNTISFTDLDQDSYLLHIYTRDYFFPPFRVDVSAATAEAGAADGQEQVAGQGPVNLVEVFQTYRGNEWSNKGPKYGSGRGKCEVQLSPNGSKDFYQKRAGFDLMSFFKNPMILMGVVMAAMAFGMPYLMENMDAETKAEFDEMSKKSPLTGEQAATAAIQNFDLAGWMAGKTSGSSSVSKKR